jgi:DNA-directed RNA polymerase subunit K/omega
MTFQSDQPIEDIIDDNEDEVEEDDDDNDDDNDDNDDDDDDDTNNNEEEEDDEEEDEEEEEEDAVENDDNNDFEDGVIKENITKDINPDTNNIIKNIYNSDDEEDDDDFDEDYLQKIDDDLQKEIITEHHHELMKHNTAEIETLCKIVRNTNGVIVDPLHKTVPFVTRYEEAKIIGERAQQLEAGSKPFIEIKPNIIDSYLIALEEYKQKKIPFIIRRPLPNGGSEYWRLTDLEQIR